jgi:hypothetical protein
MANHDHLLIENAQGRRRLKGMDTHRSNRPHGRVGNLFHGRFKAILVQKDFGFCFAVSRAQFRSG